MGFLKWAFLAAVSFVARGADIVVTAGASTFQSLPITNAAVAGASGVLVDGGFAATPNTAWAGKIVLVQRGAPVGGTSINFATKILAVQSSGGLAAVIFDNVSRALTAVTMDPAVSMIPAVLITLEDGLELKTKAGTSVTISGPIAAPPVKTWGVPDPTGHKGELLISDGEKFVFAKGGLTTSTTVDKGKPVSFTVGLSGDLPFKFEWMKDGKLIVGATNATFSIARAVPSDAGRYVCRSSTATGVAMNRLFVLTVK